MPVIGILATASPDATANRLRAFREGLTVAGYVEGQNVKIEYDGRRQPSCGGTSRMTRECQVRIAKLAEVPALRDLAFEQELDFGADEIEAPEIADQTLGFKRREAATLRRPRPWRIDRIERVHIEGEIGGAAADDLSRLLGRPPPTFVMRQQPKRGWPGQARP